jgi:hypothetical protein
VVAGQPSRPNVVTSDIDGLDGSLNDGLTRRRQKPGTAFRIQRLISFGNRVPL